jgi:hypothetical protein
MGTNNIRSERRQVTRRNGKDRRVNPYVCTTPDLRILKTRRIKDRRKNV